MDETGAFSLKDWETFYVIIGSSAGALTGLQFVVLTLITDSGALRGSGETLAAFGSPNVVHFCSALLVSAILTAPWHGMWTPGIAAALCGVGGLIYCVAVLRRAMRQNEYKPVLEDWIWHTTLPTLAYAAMIYAGIELTRLAEQAEYIIGVSVLVLVFVGIHNAWDTVAYVTTLRMTELRDQEAAARAAERPVAEPRATAPRPDATPRAATSAASGENSPQLEPGPPPPPSQTPH